MRGDPEPMTAPARIDVHQHLIPPERHHAMSGHAAAYGWPAPAWDRQSAIAMMDRRSITTGMLSYAAPTGPPNDPAAARAAARSINEYTAELVKDRPDRFGHFAVLPLPDLDAALTEATHALDELNADGVVLLTNTHGHYLGDPMLEPLWTELNTRDAVVLIHPTAPPGPALPDLPAPLVDFPYDTTRTALHLVLSKVPRRHPRIKMILPHAGGFLPYAAHRLASAGRLRPDTTPEDILTDLRRFYFDTAFAAGPATLPSLLTFAAPGHVLYGSDFPMVPEEWGTDFDAALDNHPHWPPEQLNAVNRTNAQALLPRLTHP